MGYSRTAIKGVGWLGGLRLATRGFAFVKFAIIARFLAPTDLGLFGIVAMTLALFETLTETGVNMILIKKDDLSKSIDTAWVISIIRGLVISLFLMVASQPISWFFREPRAMNLLMVAALIPLIRGLINPAVITFQRQLAFHRETWFRSILLLVEVAATIFLVIWLRSVLGLLLGMLVAAIVEVGLSWKLCAPRPKLRIDPGELKMILGIGKWLNITVITNFLALQADNVVVGRLLGTSTLGIYQLAFKLAHDPLVEVGNVVSQTAYPIYAKFKDDTDRVWRAFLRSFGVVLLLTIMVVLPLVLVPEWVVSWFGPQWNEAVVVIPLLALAGLVRAMTSVAAPVFLTYDRTKHLASISLVRLIGLLIGIAILLKPMGLVGVAMAVLLSNAIVQPIMWWGLRGGRKGN